jgi:hypothetical protein
MFTRVSPRLHWLVVGQRTFSVSVVQAIDGSTQTNRTAHTLTCTTGVLYFTTMRCRTWQLMMEYYA